MTAELPWIPPDLGVMRFSWSCFQEVLGGFTGVSSRGLGQDAARSSV